jgi:hypothetical protein
MQMSTTEPAQAVALFHGDYGKEKEPAEWFILFQLLLLAT